MNEHLKYSNYKEQMGRLKKAFNCEFFLEAIAIEYAILEDRVESLLRHSNAFNLEKHTTLQRKLKRLTELQRNKKGLIRNYITTELLDDIKAWKDERNPLTHALLKQDLHTEDLRETAAEGYRLAKLLCSKATSYRRKIEKSEK